MILLHKGSIIFVGEVIYYFYIFGLTIASIYSSNLLVLTSSNAHPLDSNIFMSRGSPFFIKIYFY